MAHYPARIDRLPELPVPINLIDDKEEFEKVHTKIRNGVRHDYATCLALMTARTSASTVTASGLAWTACCSAACASRLDIWSATSAPMASPRVVSDTPRCDDRPSAASR